MTQTFEPIYWIDCCQFLITRLPIYDTFKYTSQISGKEKRPYVQMHRVCEIFRLRKEFGTPHGQTQRGNPQRRRRSTGNFTRFSNTLLQNWFTVPIFTLIIDNLTIFFNPLTGKRIRLRPVWKNLWKLQILVLSRQESQRYLPMPNCKFFY